MVYVPTDEHPLPVSSGITQLTSDVTAGPGSGSQAATIAADAVTNAKAANMAQSTIKGRAVGAGTGDPTDLTATQATAILDPVVGDSGSGGTKGLVPAPGSGDAAAGKFLKADGTFAVPSGGGNAFGTVAVSGQSDAVADQANDTLTLAAGANITLTTNAGTDTVTIAAAGASLPAYKGAMVTKAADQTAANYSAGAVVAWDSELYDTDSFHESVTNPSRLTIPSGVTKVNITAALCLTLVAANEWTLVLLQKNGSPTFSGASANFSTSNGTSRFPSTTVIGVPVTAGDYFEAFLQTQIDTSITVLAARSCFTIQVVE